LKTREKQNTPQDQKGKGIKGLSLYPLDFGEALSALLKIKPEPKPKKKSKRK